MRSRISIVIVGVLAALALVAVPGATAATDIHTATLKGTVAYPAANGKAKNQLDDGVRDFEAEIEDARSLAGKRVRFVVKGQLVGAATVDAFGDAEIDRAGAGVPRVVTGSPIRITLTNGALVAYGRFN